VDFCLVHLSDFHLRTSTQTETDKVLSSLSQDLESRLSSLDLPSPHIALSGDLAYGGTDEEYAMVESFVDDISQRAHARSTVFCGGNHDVNWSLLAPISGDLMNGMVERGGSTKATEEKFGVASDRDTLKAGMGPYYSFLERRGVKSAPELYYIKSLAVANLRLNLISLNSAYLFSKKYNYHGYLGVGQMSAAEREIAAQGGQSFNITLVHHPLEAIVPLSQEETKRHLFSFSDIVLNGHVHSPRVSVEYTGKMLGRSRPGPPPVISCARCVFDEVKESTVTSGYSIIGLDFEYERIASIKVWEVQFDRSNDRWYVDEKKGTYPMVVKTPTASEMDDRGELIPTDSVGPKVTDQERRLLKKWKQGGSASS
jgi:predicted MPP superfamily phosphohydrolase